MQTSHSPPKESRDNVDVSPKAPRHSKDKRRPPTLTFVVVWLAGALLSLARVPGVAVRTVWAEDGSVFLEDYLKSGLSLLAPYDGYLHVLPRLIVAIAAAVFGLEAYAVVLTVGCSIVIGLVAALTYCCSASLTSNQTAKLAWASIPVLVAPGALETMGNTANLHWYLLWLAPWLLLAIPKTPIHKLVLSSSSLIVALSEIQCLIFLPLVFWRIRCKSTWWAKGGLTIGLTCQLMTYLTSPRERSGMGQDWDLRSVIYGYFLNSSAALIFGSSTAIAKNIQTFGAAPIILSATPFAIVLIFIIRFADGTMRAVGLIWLFASAITWSAAVIINPAPYFKYSEYDSLENWSGFFLSRYSTAPSMFLLALVPLLIAISCAAGPINKPGSRVGSVQLRATLTGAFLIMQFIHFFPIDAAGSTGPNWAEEIRNALLACKADTALHTVSLLQAPDGWNSTIQCEDLQ